MRVQATTVTRISPLGDPAGPGPFAVAPVARERWRTGDYVLARVRRIGREIRHIERPDGRMAEVAPGDLLIGALGRRAATLQAVGDWRAIPDDGSMHLLTSAGLLGYATSVSPFMGTPVELGYAGHVLMDGIPSRMADWALGDALSPPGLPRFSLPVVLIVGTSMSAGKTESGKVAVRLLAGLGLSVVAAKLTGAARYRDSLGLLDAGAEAVFDFVDGGLPSSACAREEYRPAVRHVLGLLAATGADVAVIEAGASPLEEYNGDTLTEMISPCVRCMVLCASDPYAVAGLVRAFGRHPDVVAGGAANTSTGVALVRRLAGLPALDLTDASTHGEFLRILLRQVGPLDLPSHAGSAGIPAQPALRRRGQARP